MTQIDSQFPSPKLLVLGCGSQIGQAVARAGSSEPWVKVLAVPRKEVDITDLEALEAALDRYQPDIIFNGAGFNDVDQTEKDPEPSYRVNVVAVKQLAELCKARNLPLIHLSTDLVFDGKYSSGYREDDAVAPVGVYGNHKWQSEELLRELLPDRHIILRVSWLFSAYGGNVVSRTLASLRTGAELRVADDRKGCPTSSDDVARVILAMVRQLFSGANCWGTYHYCGAGETSRYGLCKEILMAAAQYESLRLDQLVSVSGDDVSHLVERPQSSVLQCKRIMSHFGIKQRPWRNELSAVIRTHYRRMQQKKTDKLLHG